MACENGRVFVAFVVVVDWPSASCYLRIEKNTLGCNKYSFRKLDIAVKFTDRGYFYRLRVKSIGEKRSLLIAAYSKSAVCTYQAAVETSNTVNTESEQTSLAYNHHFILYINTVYLIHKHILPINETIHTCWRLTQLGQIQGSKHG